MNQRFVGRHFELARLVEEMRRAADGTPRVVVVTGEPGIGKTALGRRFVQEAPEFRLLEASGEEAEALLRFGIIEQLVQGLPLPIPPALEHLGTADTEDHDPIWVGAGLLELMGLLQAAGPVLLFLDDAQWADRPSLQAIVFALRRLQADRVLTVVVSRHGSPRGELAGFHRLVEHGHGTWLRLKGLDALSIRELGTLMGVTHLSSRAADRIRAHTGGSPLHAGAILEELDPEVLREASDVPLPSPRDFSSLVVQRLDACERGARDLVQAAAVLGFSCALTVAARLADLEDPLPALEDAVNARLLEERGAPAVRSIAFTHPLVQAAAYHALGPARRAALHARAATLVHDEATVLRHRVAAARGPDPELAAQLVDFGRQCADRGLWDQAADALLSGSRLTGDGPDADARLLEAAENMLSAGSVADVVALVGEVEEMEPTPRRGLVLGSLALAEGRYDGAQEILTSAYDSLAGDDARTAEGIAALLAHVHMGRGHGSEAAIWASRSLEASVGRVPAADPLSVLAIGLVFAGRAAEALAAVASLADPRHIGDSTPLDGYLGRGFARCVSDDPAGARSDLQVVSGQLRVRGPAHMAIAALTTLATAEYRLGAWDDAIVHGQLAASLAADAEQTWLLPAAHAAACAPLAGRGDWAEAQRHVHAAREVASSIRAEFAGTAQAAYAAALLANARGDHAGVVAALDPILPISDLDGIREPGILDWQLLYAQALLRLDRLRDVESVLGHFERLASERDRMTSVAPAARVRGQLEAALGRSDDAEVAFLSSLALLDDTDIPFERGTTELEYGAFLRQRGHGRAAAWQLQAAHDHFADLGARPFLERCERELALCGVTEVAGGSRVWGRLTPKEISVARLVASGRTNRQAAEELVLSVKTIEYHLGNVFGKLGIRSREELASVLGHGEAPARTVANRTP